MHCPWRQLHIGQQVLSASGHAHAAAPGYDTTYLWGHRNFEAWSMFESIPHYSGHVLHISPGHYLPVSKSGRQACATDPAAQGKA